VLQLAKKLLNKCIFFLFVFRGSDVLISIIKQISLCTWSISENFDVLVISMARHSGGSSYSWFDYLLQVRLPVHSVGTYFIRPRLKWAGRWKQANMTPLKSTEKNKGEGGMEW